MSTKYTIFNTDCISIFGDVFEEKLIFLRCESLKKASFYIENNTSTLQVSINSEVFYDVCKNYIKYMENQKELE